MVETTNMAEIMNRFMETSNITIIPKDTRVHRLIILRLLYSFGGSIDIQACITELKESGVEIGEYNVKNTIVALRQNLTTMQIHEWLALVDLIQLENFQQISDILTQYYSDRIFQSPIWRLHKIIQVCIMCSSVWQQVFFHGCSTKHVRVLAGKYQLEGRKAV
jgi:hypothetical protein